MSSCDCSIRTGEQCDFHRQVSMRAWDEHFAQQALAYIQGLAKREPVFVKLLPKK